MYDKYAIKQEHCFREYHQHLPNLQGLDEESPERLDRSKELLQGELMSIFTEVHSQLTSLFVNLQELLL